MLLASLRYRRKQMIRIPVMRPPCQELRGLVDENSLGLGLLETVANVQDCGF